MNEERRKQEALFRYSVLGALVSAELEHGDVRALCEQQALIGDNYFDRSTTTILTG
jgi:hypothetical protein